MIVKVCGMRDADNIRAVSQLDIDMIGFVFWPESPRFVQMISSQAGIIPDYSKERLDSSRMQVTGSVTDASPSIKRVGVFVDDMPQNIVTRVYNYSLDYVQLHGNEQRTMIDNLRRTLDPDIRSGVKIMKALSIASPADIEKYKQYGDSVDLFLFDTQCQTIGGSGEQFDWSMLEAYDGDIPFLLAGGIGPDDVQRVLSFHHPKFAGVDLNSRFETVPGMKDVEKLKRFIDQIKG